MTTASNIVQNVLAELGQVDPVFGLFTATGGSATTFINTNFANYENPPDTDAFKNYLAIVVRDAAGAGADPEGRWAICSAYVDGTQTGTIASVTTAIASGDELMLAKQDKFPINQILWAMNRGLEELGDLPSNANTSLTTASAQTEYNVPVAVKRGLKQIWIQGRTNDANDNQWFQVYDRRNELTSAGTASIVYIPQYPSGRTIRLIYDGPHDVVTAYNSTINEYVHPTVATCATIVKLLEWYNRRDENQDSSSYMLYLENLYRNEKLPVALLKNPIPKVGRTPKYAVFGKELQNIPPNPLET